MKTKLVLSKRRPQQLNLFKKDLRFFGGQLLLGKRKSQRPLSTKDPLHLVMRSSWAMGETSFLRPQHKKPIEALIQRLALKYGVRVYQRAIASNHVHLLIKIETRRSYQAFIRVLSSKIALLIMKQKSFRQFQRALAERSKRGDGLKAPITVDESVVRAPRGGQRSVALKGTQRSALPTEAQGKGQKFWQFRPFNRVLFWGRDYQTCKGYLVQNTLEAIGFISYRPRKNFYAKWISENIPPAASG